MTWDIRHNKMLFKRNKTLLGLNIGSGYIKMVEFKDTGSVYTLKNFGLAGLPADVIVDGTIMDAETIITTLKNLAANLKIRKKRVCTSISGHAVIIKKVTLPQVDETTLEATIQQEATQHIPYDINDVNLDFQILGPNRDNQENIDIILVAVKKETINDYLMLVEEAGFIPVVLDVDTFALENAYEHNYEEEHASQVTALVDIGANLTSINIIYQGVTCFSRNITFGSRIITEQLQKNFTLNYDNAEILKLGTPVNERLKPAEVYHVINEALFSLINEIDKAIEFFHNSSLVPERVQKIVLSGGGSLTPGITREIQQTTGLDVELIDPFRNIMIPEKNFDREYIQAIGPLAAVAAGLALRKDETVR